MPWVQCKYHGMIAANSQPGWVFDHVPDDANVAAQEKDMIEAERPDFEACLKRNLREWPTCPYGTITFVLIPRRHDQNIVAIWQCNGYHYEATSP